MKTPTIEHLLTLTTDETKDLILNFLTHHKIPYLADADLNFIVTTQYPFEKLPLVAVHMDTVSSTPPKMKDIACHKGVLSLKKQSKAGCLGADDRAGIYIALQLLASETKTKFEFAFFDLEEKGAIGSSHFAKFNYNYQCFIGLDRATRRGEQNIATYGYDNDDLLDLVLEHTDYKLSSGSFSDCSNLSDSSPDTPCFNISVGYQNEHGADEILNKDDMQETLELMMTLDIPQGVVYQAKEQVYSWETPRYGYREMTAPLLCDECGQHLPLFTDEYGYLLCADCLEISTKQDFAVFAEV